MRYRDMERRLQALEAGPRIDDTKGDGYAPESWSRLARWAIAVHAMGGWDAAVAAVKAGAPMPEPSPYNRSSGGALWDITLFWQRGVHRFLNRQHEQDALWIIAACVEQLLDEGTPRREILRWETTGRAVWQACMDTLAEGEHATP